MDIFGGHSVTQSLIQQTSWNKLKGSICLLTFAHKCPEERKKKRKKYNSEGHPEQQTDILNLSWRASRGEQHTC